jgi:UDP-glucose 4-epimerase
LTPKSGFEHILSRKKNLPKAAKRIKRTRKQHKQTIWLHFCTSIYKKSLMAKILITGGTGFIGSHTVVDMLNHGYEVVSVDNNVNSDAATLKGMRAIAKKQFKHYRIDLTDIKKTRRVFLENPDIAAVVHFAARKHVNESVEIPLEYYRNNLNSQMVILELMQEFKVPNLIFSSSCSVYGQSEELPVTEETPLQATQCPYARTKVVGEMILRDVAHANKGLNISCLRYFNPAGAHPSAKIGESPINAASNLVPVITETAIGNRKQMAVHGTDYPTRDGSCIRDYIHVMDLAQAHTLAVQYLLGKKNKENFELFNFGIGDGVSVLEAINAFEKVTKLKLSYQLGPRREGDVAAVYADYSKAKKHLGWTPKYGIEEIMLHAWNWEKARNKQSKTVKK